MSEQVLVLQARQYPPVIQIDKVKLNLRILNLFEVAFSSLDGFNFSLHPTLQRGSVTVECDSMGYGRITVGNITKDFTATDEMNAIGIVGEITDLAGVSARITPTPNGNLVIEGTITRKVGDIAKVGFGGSFIVNIDSLLRTHPGIARAMDAIERRQEYIDNEVRRAIR